MRITNVAPARSVPQHRERETRENPTEPYRYRFSESHIIVDLSSEALRQVGTASAEARPSHPPLFVYDDTGAFAYDTPTNRVTKSTAIIAAIDDGQGEAREVLEIDEAPLPSFVSFDGRLSSPSPF